MSVTTYKLGLQIVVCYSVNEFSYLPSSTFAMSSFKKVRPIYLVEFRLIRSTDESRRQHETVEKKNSFLCWTCAEVGENTRMAMYNLKKNSKG